MLLFLQINYKKFNDVKIRSIRISKTDLTSIKKPVSGLEKQEIAMKARLLNLRYARNKNFKLRPLINQKRAQYFIRRPRWLYRKKKRSVQFYRSYSFLKDRLTHYRVAARVRGKERFKRYRVNLKYGQVARVWVRVFEDDEFRGWRKAKYRYYKKVNKRKGVMVKRRPTLLDYKKGIGQFKYYYRNKFTKANIKKFITARYHKRYRLFKSRPLIRIATRKLYRRRRFSYRHRRSVIRSYSLRKLYRIAFTRRSLQQPLRKLRNNLRVWLLKRRRDRIMQSFRGNPVFIRKTFAFRRKNRLKFRAFRNYRRMVKNIFKIRSTRSKSTVYLKKNALVMFKHLLRLKPDVRFAAKLKFKNLLNKRSAKKSFRRQFRDGLLTRLRFFLRKSRRRGKRRERKKIKFYSAIKRLFPIKKRRYNKRYHRKVPTNKSLRLRSAYNKRKLIERVSVRHYRHGLLSKFRKTKFYRRRLSYLSLVRTFKRANVKVYQNNRVISFLNSLVPFKHVGLSELANKYRIARTNRALNRYTYLYNTIFKGYRDYRREKSELTRKITTKYKRVRRSKHRRRRLALRLQRRSRRRIIKRARYRKLDSLTGCSSSIYTLRYKLRRRNRAFSHALKKSTLIKKTYLNELSSLDNRYNVFNSFSRLYFLKRKIKARKRRRKHRAVFTINSLFYSRPKLRLYRQLKLIKKRLIWEKSLAKEEFFFIKREASLDKLFKRKKFLGQRLRKKHLLRRKRTKELRRRVRGRKSIAKSLKFKLIKRFFLSSLAENLGWQLFDLRLLAQKRRARARIKRLRLKRKLPIKRKVHRASRKNRYYRFRHRMRRRRLRFLRRKFKRQFKSLKLVRRLLDQLSEYPIFRLKPHPLWRRSLTELDDISKKKLFLQSQALKFLKRGLIVKRGFFYNRRRFYKPILSTKNLQIIRKQTYRFARTYKRLVLRKKNRVHNYRHWFELRRRRYMHRRRFFSSKPKQRNRRHVTHLPTVHIAQTNSNYFVYVLVNKQIVYLKSTGQCGFEGKKRKAPYAVERLGVDIGNWLLTRNMRYVTLRPHFPKLFYVARLVVKGMLKPYRLKPPRKVFNLRNRRIVFHKKPDKHRVEVITIRRLLVKAHNGLRLPVRRRL